MKPELVQLALHKQRLQLRSAAQRDAIIHHVAGFQPLFRGVDRVGDGLQWMRNNVPVVSAIAVVLAVVRPRTALRWARRGWLGWQLMQRVRRQLQ